MSTDASPDLAVTVIIPVYNGERYLEQSISSVLNQTVPPVQLIVVDDGSTDGSLDVIARVTAQSTIPVQIVSHSNRGQSASRNAAAQLATAPLLAFLDQDDLWRPEHLERLTAPFALDRSLGWVYSDIDEMDLHGRIVTRNLMQAVNAAGPMNSVTDIIRQDCMILPTASIIRASAYADVDGFDPELQGYEDDDLFFRIFRAGWSSLYVPEPLAAFRIHRESSSRSASFRKSRMRYFEKIVAELPDDVQLNRYYITDHMQPRMLASTLFDYAKALRVKDDPEARAIVGDLNRLLTWANNGGTPRTRIRLGLFVMRLPRLARGLLAVRATLPPWMRPRVPPVLLRS